VLAPVASELHDEWAQAPPADGCVAFAWQGVLRDLVPGERVHPLEPGPSAIVRRADILSVSRHDIPGGLALRTIGSWMAPRSELLLTAGALGGLLLRFESGAIVAARRYPAVAAAVEVDATGAGDTMLAGFVAARIAAGPSGRRPARDLHLGAVAASLLMEGPGMDSVPTFEGIRRRLGRGS
jgi:sugar/nucleoside kinase (ribokinase family)